MTGSHTIENRDVISFFDGLAKGWDSCTHHDIQLIKTILTVSAASGADKVLDIACGTGVMFKPLADMGAKHITGIDISPEMIKKAREKFPEDAVKLYADDVLQFSGGSDYDLITVYSAYPHFADKEALAAKVSSLLAKGGRFTIAHSESREKINSRHQGHEVSNVSVELLSAEEEAAKLSGYFNIDTLVDNRVMYIISGTKNDIKA